jgi:DNA-binding GntR family transcriptional regulator
VTEIVNHPLQLNNSKGCKGWFINRDLHQKQQIMKKGYKDIFERMGLTPEECYLKQKNEIERLKTALEAKYKHHMDSKEQIVEYLTELRNRPMIDTHKILLDKITPEIEEIIDENLNSQNYYDNGYTPDNEDDYQKKNKKVNKYE